MRPAAYHGKSPISDAATATIGLTESLLTATYCLAWGLGMGITSLGLSLWTRQPVLTAWSTPGAALLAGTAGATPVSFNFAGRCVQACDLVSLAPGDAVTGTLAPNQRPTM